MRKKVHGLILCVVLLFLLSLPAYAANRVDTMDIQAVLYEDGSMYVTQVWEGNFDEGTVKECPSCENTHIRPATEEETGRLEKLLEQGKPILRIKEEQIL